MKYNNLTDFLPQLKQTVLDLQATNSSNKKIEILKKAYLQCKEIGSWLSLIYDPQKIFGITSSVVRKNHDIIDQSLQTNLWNILHCLVDRSLTGHKAIGVVNSFLSRLRYKDDTNFILNIIDKDLKIGMGVSVINKAIPGLIETFDVALANKFNIKHIKEWTDWVASRKLDGCRCIIIKQNGKVTCKSRQGKDYLTLDVIVKEILMLDGDFVLDGEVYIIDDDENENYQGTMKEIRKKNHTIKNPILSVFDILTIDEFKNKTSQAVLIDRLKRYQSFVDTPHIQLLKQIKLKDENHFVQLKQKSVDCGWEGLIIRKHNVGYAGKRSNDLLKCKDMFDTEYEIVGTENGTKAILIDGVMTEMNIMASAAIIHKGNKVGVGSGWSDQQRLEFFDSPEKLIGQIATIQSFEETQNKKGEYSLRFPVVKMLHGKKRTT